MFKAIIFDFFGTLSSEVAPVWLKKHFSPSEIAELRRKYIEDLDRGDMSENNWFALLSRATGISSETIRTEWLALAVVNPDMINLARELHARYKIAILSDAPPAFFHEVLKKNGVENLFDAVIVSSEIHMTKADDGAYQAALKALSVSARQAIMVDDNPANAEHARVLGIAGFAFTGYEQFKKDLMSIGVEI